MTASVWSGVVDLKDGYLSGALSFVEVRQYQTLEGYRLLVSCLLLLTCDAHQKSSQWYQSFDACVVGAGTTLLLSAADRQQPSHMTRTRTHDGPGMLALAAVIVAAKAS